MYPQTALHQEHSRELLISELPHPKPNPSARSVHHGSNDPTEQTMKVSERSQTDDLMPDLEYVDELTISKALGVNDDVDSPFRAAQFLQHAARRALQDQTMSQSEVFRSLAPLVIFLWILGVAAFLPRKYSGLEKKYGTADLQAHLIVGILGGVGILLFILRGGIWVGSVLIKSFCDAELLNLFRKGEMVDSEGVRMGDADMVLGNLFR